ncbi:two-component system response regulator (stage 0 sporulation protein F) [Bradyrhizobium sp. USDA 4369]
MPTVLIIDDDSATRAALETLLKKKKFCVFLAPDGPTGIRLIGSVSFDAVVIDMFMPGMDGIATIRELIKIDPTVPFIAISGYAFTDKKQGAPDFLGMAIKLGATAALQKPFDILDLLEAVDRAIEVRQRLLADARGNLAPHRHVSGGPHDEHPGR